MGPVVSEGLTPACTAGKAACCDLDIELPHRGVWCPKTPAAVPEAQSLSRAQAEAEPFRTDPNGSVLRELDYCRFGTLKKKI